MSNTRLKKNTIGRILLFIICYFIIVGIFQYVGHTIIGNSITNVDYKISSTERVIINVFSLVGIFITIWLFMKFADKEPFVKIGFQTKNKLKEFIAGIILGPLIMSIGYFLLILSEEIFFIKVNFDVKELMILIITYTIVAITEEVVFRGYILKNLMSSFNKYTALIVTSIIFSIAHGLNPNIDLLSFLNLFLAGIVCGLSYVYTKNLWFPIAIHFSWNLFQSLFGFNVSGRDAYSIIEFKINVSNFINGGAFGFEGSYLSIIAQIIAIIGIGLYYNKKETTIVHK